VIRELIAFVFFIILHILKQHVIFQQNFIICFSNNQKVMKNLWSFYITRVFSLMSILVISGSAFVNLSFAQKQEDSKPRINIDVNKKYDEKGNIILYDSSYSYSWSGRGNDIDIDSVFENSHHHLELYNYDDDHFFPHSYIFPEFPDFNLEPFFRYSDSSFIWHDDLDTVLRRNFHDDFLNWNFDYKQFDYKSIDSIIDNFPYSFHNFPGIPDWHFQPFGPCDSMDFWYSPFEDRFPDSYFDDLEKHLKEMRKYFEKNYGSSPDGHNNLYRRDLKDKLPNKPKKNTISIKT